MLLRINTTDNQRRANVTNNTKNNNSNRSTNTSSNNCRPYYGHCFGCMQCGHRYTECSTTPPEKIAYIRANFSELLADYKRQKANAEGISELLALPSTSTNVPFVPLNSKDVTTPQ